MNGARNEFPIQPDANGEFPTPLDGALWMASFGIPQTPLRGKKPFLTEWQHSATTNPEHIRGWASQYQGCNFGSVAHDGQHFVFEADSTDVRTRFNSSGNDFSSGLVIRSREGRGHRWYKHAAGVKNISQAYTKHADFSLRAESQQAVSPGSIHPETEQQYRVVKGESPSTPSAAEIAFWESERAEKKTGGKPKVPRNEHGLVPRGARQLNDPANPTVIPSESDLDAAFPFYDGVDSPDLPMLIEGFMPEGVTFIGSLSGTGKTWVGLSIAKALTSGTPLWDVFPVVEITGVLFLIPETSDAALKRRMKKMGITQDKTRFRSQCAREGP